MGLNVPASTTDLAPRDRGAPGAPSVLAIAFLLALAAGYAAATGRGPLVAAAFLALAVGAIGIAVFVRDPVRALIWLWIAVVLNASLSMLAGYSSSAGAEVRQADEVLVVLLVGLTAWRTTKTRIRVPARFVLPGICVAVFGLLGAVLHQVPVVVALSGAWLGLKLWIMVGVTLLLPWRSSDLVRVYSAMTKTGLFVAAVGIADYLTHNGVSRSLHLTAFTLRYEGSRANSVYAIFAHPNEYSLFMSILFALTFARFAGTRRRSDLLLALVFAASVVTSLRLKGFLSLAAVVMIVALAEAALQNRRSLTILLVGGLLVVAVYSVEGSVIASQVSTYTSSETTARAKLYKTGARIASDDFPLGAGFGRFGSYPSSLYYSPVYSEYGLSSFYGLSRTNPGDINDTSWPSVLGETGYAGISAYLLGLVILFVALGRRLRAAPAALRWVPLAALCMLAVLLTDALGDPTLFDWISVTSFALVFGPAMIVAKPRRKDRRLALQQS